MTIAQQIKAFYVSINPGNGIERFDWECLIKECEEKGQAEQDWEYGTTTYNFMDGSVLIICDNEVRV